MLTAKRLSSFIRRESLLKKVRTFNEEFQNSGSVFEIPGWLSYRCDLISVPKFTPVPSFSSVLIYMIQHYTKVIPERSSPRLPFLAMYLFTWYSTTWKSYRFGSKVHTCAGAELICRYENSFQSCERDMIVTYLLNAMLVRQYKTLSAVKTAHVNAIWLFDFVTGVKVAPVVCKHPLCHLWYYEETEFIVSDCQWFIILFSRSGCRRFLFVLDPIPDCSHIKRIL